MLTLIRRKRLQHFKQDHVRHRNAIALNKLTIQTLNLKVDHLDRVGAETYKNMVTLRAEVKDLTATNVALKDKLNREEHVTAVQAKKIEKLILEVSRLTEGNNRLRDSLQDE